MTRTNLDLGDVREALALFGDARQQVLAVYLFGSVAAGQTRVSSDVDVAVLMKAPLRPDDLDRCARRKLLDSFVEQLEAVLGARVDLIDLAAAGYILKHQVLSRGMKVFERDAAAVRDWEARALIEYLDLSCMERMLAARALADVRRIASW